MGSWAFLLVSIIVPKGSVTVEHQVRLSGGESNVGGHLGARRSDLEQLGASIMRQPAGSPSSKCQIESGAPLCCRQPRCQNPRPTLDGVRLKRNVQRQPNSQSKYIVRRDDGSEPGKRQNSGSTRSALPERLGHGGDRRFPRPCPREARGLFEKSCSIFSLADLRAQAFHLKSEAAQRRIECIARATACSRSCPTSPRS
jgi:hypothetical protein